jgi:hypothetical protein
MTERSRIDAELDHVQLSPDGSRLILLLHDAAGHKVSLSLPSSCVSAVLTATPHPADTGILHSVETWNMSLADNGQDMILTLGTSEGMVISFAIKAWQAQGMATLATYGTTRDCSTRSVH